MRGVILATYVVTFPFVVFAAFFPEIVLSAFTSDPAVVEGAQTALRIVALLMLLVIPAEMWLTAVGGTGDTDAAFVIELLLSVAMVGGAAVTALALDLSLAYIWLSIGTAWLLSLPLAYAWVRSGRWQRRAV